MSSKLFIATLFLLISHANAECATPTQESEGGQRVSRFNCEPQWFGYNCQGGIPQACCYGPCFDAAEEHRKEAEAEPHSICRENAYYNNITRCVTQNCESDGQGAYIYWTKYLCSSHEMYHRPVKEDLEKNGASPWKCEKHGENEKNETITLECQEDEEHKREESTTSIAPQATQQNTNAATGSESEAKPQETGAAMRAQGRRTESVWSGSLAVVFGAALML